MFYTTRLMLRGFDPRCDTQPWLHSLNDAATARAIFPDGIRPWSLEEVKGILEHLTKKDQPPCFAVCVRPDDSSDNHPANLKPTQDLYVLDDGKTPRYPMIGTLTIRPPGSKVSYTRRVVDMGLGFDKEYQGKGYGTELLEWACEYAFNVMGLHRIQLQSEAENTPARKCWKKVGFVEEGVLRKALFIDGQWKDEIALGLLVEEWAERRAEVARKEFVVVEKKQK